MAIPALFYIDSLAELFSAVQSSGIFPDSKYFVDCIPVGDPSLIVAAYQKEKNNPDFELKTFVQDHFVLPEAKASLYTSANKTINKHLEDLWDTLQRQPDIPKGTLIPLPHSYIVPGGRFREIYYWDSYFTLLGVQVSKRSNIIQNVADNLAHLINTIGFIPNGNRTYYIGRSQPPFFPLIVELLAEEKGPAILEKYLPQLEKEYAFWMDGSDTLSNANSSAYRVVQMPNGSILNRYWDNFDFPRPESHIEDIHLAQKSGRDPKTVYRHIRAAAESGWDFSTRWFKDGNTMETIQTTDIIPVDLNCLLLHAEELLLKIYTENKNEAAKAVFTKKVEARKSALQLYCWNEDEGFYFDYNHVSNQQSPLFTIAAAYPLFFRLASQAQAKRVAAVIEEKFLQAGGVLTTVYQTGQQWDAPNGWAPLQWMAFKGLKNYGFAKIAGEIKNRWMATNEKVYAETGKMMEKYNVMNNATKAGGGEYPNQDGFGWTNGVYLKLQSEL
jgi:alpha,alpha-trehalase